MATYVLVHGAWHGGWCWSRVAPLLRERGHDVYTPTLTGLGERVHLATPDVNLSTHITDVVNVIEFEDLRDVILMGHSYGGMAITGAADRTAERISALVYLDAIVPNDGQSMVDFTGASFDAEKEWQRPVPPPPFGAFGITAASDLQWVQSKLTPHPTATLLEAVKLSQPLEQRSFRRVYILASGAPGAPQMPTPFDAISQRLKDSPAWRFESLPTGHDVMVTMPRELSEILLSLAD